MSNLTKGILLTLLSVLTGAAMALLYKLIGEGISTYEKVFFRGFASMVVSLAIIRHIRVQAAKKKLKHKLPDDLAATANAYVTPTSAINAVATTTAATIVPEPLHPQVYEVKPEVLLKPTDPYLFWFMG
ncbi:hypothetical protein [Psittacicella hinzii]|uniref:Uncharacterized protein n=1 Tax=Psittacicella hinzii TaxID=2028575 RepID=A0A3A1YFX4_9GAMM|nr:hypothetical protein [Psittacicella hinzii]RIY37153.1 hypothetical protein CKF58_05215 [Psittacicella hinzii]